MWLGGNVPIVRPPKTQWERFRTFFSPQVNAAIVGWALALVSGGFLLKDRAKVQDLQHDKLSLQTEIGRLTTEKKSAEDRMAFYSSLPFQVPTLVSNLNYFFLNDPANRQQLTEFFLNLSALGTNLVGELRSFKPSFELALNGTNLGTFNLIDSPRPPQIALHVRNPSQITAEHLAIDLLAPLDATNVIAHGWASEESGEMGGYHALLNGKTEVIRRRFGHWRWVAPHSLMNKGIFVVPNFAITNYNGIYLPVDIFVSADRATTMKFSPYLMFEEGREKMVVLPIQDGKTIAYPK